MKIGLNITDWQGKWEKLSSDLYEITDVSETLFENDPDYGNGCKVRLISGINESKIPGYHSRKGWVTVCSDKAWTAEFCGFEKWRLKKVE